MKTILFSLALTMGMLYGWCNAVSGQNTNATEFKPLPIVQTKFTADPAPMVYRDTVYLFTSHDEDDAEGFHMKDWLCYTSTDMVNWCDRGPVADISLFKDINDGWGKKDNGAWAPQVIERNGKFYMYCPLWGRGIGVLVADRPLGPYHNPLGNKALIPYHNDEIDPTVFVDDDGQAYLYWGNPNLWHARLNEDMISLADPITKDGSLQNPNKEQLNTMNEAGIVWKNPYHYQEGPWIYKRNGIYYMAYASTCCPEGMGWAWSYAPEGPWQQGGYIMKPDPRSSGNHPGIIDYHGKTYVFGFSYHINYQFTKKHRERRSVCVAELQFDKQGRIVELPWWEDGKAVEPVRMFNPFQRVPATTMAWSEGLKSKGTVNNMAVTAIDSGDYLMLRSVDFGKRGARRVTLGADVRQTTRVEIRLDSKDGPLAGVCTLKAGKGQAASVSLHGTAGIHNLYFVFRTKGKDTMDFRWWKMK